jgi:beta-lactamase regulating signal transducer with metallopeptidase domain
MTERAIFQLITEYVANCAWQIPLLAGGAWLLVKAIRPGVLAQHWLWLTVLAMAVVLPLRGLQDRPVLQPSVAGGEIAFLKAMQASEVHVTEARAFEPGAMERTKAQRGYEDVPLPMSARGLTLSVGATRWLLGMYAVSILLGGLRLVRGLLATRRLVRSSRELELGPQTMLVLEESCRRLRVAVPGVLESRETDGPVIVRALRPVMVLPPRFEDHAEDEVRAALLHELAHVRRRDYLVNLVCQFAALPVVWHPAVHGVQQRICRTREMLCDAIAAEEMESGAEYARCLVSLARQMLHGADARSGPHAVGLFERNTMEERVMKLTETKIAMNGKVRVLRGLCGLAAIVAVMGVAVTFHVKPTFAATPAVDAEPMVVQDVVPDVVLAQTAATKVSSSMVAPSVEAVQEKPSAQVPATGSSGISTSPSSDEDGPTAVAGKGSFVHRWIGADGKKYVMVNRNPKEPNQEEQLKEEQKLNDGQKDLDQMKREPSMMYLQSGELQKDLAGIADSGQRMKDLQRQLAELGKDVHVDLTKNPEWQKQMDEMQKRVNDPAWQKQMGELEKNIQLKIMNDPEWQKQFADLTIQPDIKLKIDLDKQMVIANAQMAKLQKEIESGELQRKLDEAKRLVEEAQKQMDAMKAKSK